MVSYILSGPTSAKLTRKSWASTPMTFPLRREIGNSAVIEKVAVNYMTAIDPDPVTVKSTGTVDNLGTIIVVQGRLLPKRHKAPPPMATEGEQEEHVRQLLESNGNTVFCEHLFCLAFSRCPQVSVRMSTNGRFAKTRA